MKKVILALVAARLLVTLTSYAAYGCFATMPYNCSGASQTVVTTYQCSYTQTNSAGTINRATGTSGNGFTNVYYQDNACVYTQTYTDCSGTFYSVTTNLPIQGSYALGNYCGPECGADCD